MKQILLYIFTGLFFIPAVAQKNLTLLSNLTFPGRTLAGAQGYVDSTGKEYALIGTSTSMAVVDISIPASPVIKFDVTTPTSLWKELAVWKKHAYVVTEGGGGVTIVDLSKLPDTVTSKVYTGDGVMAGLINRAHAVAAADTHLYLFGMQGLANGGCVMFNLADPWNPVYVGQYNLRYIHDGYVRKDTLWASEIYNGQFSVVKVTDKANPVVLNTQVTPGNFNHNSWLSDNSKFLFTADEKSNVPLGSFDVSDVSNIKLVDIYYTLKKPQNEVHNVRVLNDYLVNACYGSQVTIVDAARPDNLIEIADYPVGGGLCWDVYPFLPSGVVIATDKDNGLFIFSPTYVRACYLEGIVTDSVTTLSINGVQVEVLTTSILEQTNLNGIYKTGQADSGTFAVKFSKIGYYPKTINNVVLKNGVLTTLNVQLAPVPKFAIKGQVVRKISGLPVAGANVKLLSPIGATNLVTDASGNFIDSINYISDFDIFAGKWYYRTNCLLQQAISPSTPPFTITLDSGIYDDFTFNYGWTESGDARMGKWTIGKPKGTTFGGILANPEVDSEDDCYERCWVTGNLGGAPENDNVDSGKTVLTSPVFDITSYTKPYLRYQRWYFNRGGTLTPNDTLIVKLTNGSTTAVIEKIIGTSPSLAKWNTAQFNISDYITPSATMQFILEISDDSDTTLNHITEAGLDKFEVVDSIFLGMNTPADATQVLHFFPNPAQDQITVVLKLEQEADVIVSVVDILGKAVSVPVNEKNVSGYYEKQLNLSLLKQGIYFIKYNINGITTSVQKMVLVR